MKDKEKKMKRKIKKLFTAFLCLTLVGITLLYCGGCSLRVSAEELSRSYRREATERGEVTEEFRTAMADFSLSLFQKLITKDGENDLFSPLSAAICLSMIANGAAGETRAQMEEALGMKVDTLNKSLYAFTSSLYRADDCKLNLANSVWFRDDENQLHVNDGFLQTNADWYDAQIYASPFDSSTVKDINAWCKYYTDGMIDKMIDKIDAADMLYLVNALTFDAQWETKYEKTDVEEGPFTDYDGEKSSVQTLSSTEGIYLSADGVTGFAKNYAGNAYSFVALLPDEGIDLYEYVDALDGGAWTALWNSRERATVSVKMPEFAYGASMRFNDALEMMGMKDMFGERADFSAIGYSEWGKLYCSEVCQKTVIRVDRNGTKAAAITWGEMNGTAAPEKPRRVVLDRPFVYAIVESGTGLPLFLGAVTHL